MHDVVPVAEGDLCVRVRARVCACACVHISTIRVEAHHIKDRADEERRRLLGVVLALDDPVEQLATLVPRECSENPFVSAQPYPV